MQDPSGWSKYLNYGSSWPRQGEQTTAMAPGRNQHPSLSLLLCTKYQVKYSCLGPDKSLRLHSVCSSDYIILCAYILDLLVPLPTYIIKIHIRFFHPFPEKVFNVKENFWRFPLIEISAVMMWCEILDNLQFNKFLWNEWSLIVWCEAARRGASWSCYVIQWTIVIISCHYPLGPTLFAI